MKVSIKHCHLPALLCLLLAHAGPGVAAPADAILPPGLYQVDTETNIDVNTGRREHPKAQIDVKGATGAETRRDADGRVIAQGNGPGPQRICVPREKPAEVLLPAACTSGPARLQGGAAVFRASCGNMDSTLTMRRIDARTWSVDTHTVQHARPAGGGADTTISMMQRMLAEKARTGTPAERAEAQRMMAEFGDGHEVRAVAAQQAAAQPAVQAGLANAAAQGERAAGDMKAADIRVRQRFSRIAESCQPAKARQ